jgi:hypothetical protein
MEADKEAVALKHGVDRNGACRRFPKAARTAAGHWCFEHKPGRAPEGKS